MFGVGGITLMVGAAAELLPSDTFVIVTLCETLDNACLVGLVDASTAVMVNEPEPKLGGSGNE